MKIIKFSILQEIFSFGVIVEFQPTASSSIRQSMVLSRFWIRIRFLSAWLFQLPYSASGLANKRWRIANQEHDSWRSRTYTHKAWNLIVLKKKLKWSFGKLDFELFCWHSRVNHRRRSIFPPSLSNFIKFSFETDIFGIDKPEQYLIPLIKNDVQHLHAK